MFMRIADSRECAMLASLRFLNPPKVRSSGLGRVLSTMGLILTLCATNAQSQTVPAGQPTSAIESLTQALLALNLRVLAGNSTQKTQLLNELTQLAQVRQEALAALVQSDPAAALRIALPASLRAGLPRNVQPLVEQEITLEGVLEVSIEDHATDSRLLHVLKVDGERLALYFTAAPSADLL